MLYQYFQYVQKHKRNIHDYAAIKNASFHSNRETKLDGRDSAKRVVALCETVVLLSWEIERLNYLNLTCR